MNRSKILPILLICSFSLTSGADEIAKPVPTEMPSQHGVVLSLSAKFRCGLKRWPSDLEELKAFQEVNDIKLGIDSNWNWLLSGELTYEKSKKKMNLISISRGADGNLVTVKSVQKKPLCKKGSTQLRGANVHIDFGGKDA